MKVEIDGEKYISETEIQKKVISEMVVVLGEICGFKKEMIDSIITNYESLNPTKQTTQPKYWSNSQTRRRFKIVRVDRYGNLYGSKKKFTWNMDSVYFIRNTWNMSENMTIEDIEKIGEKLKLSKEVVGRIIYNLDKGVFDPIFRTYENLRYSHKKIPIQNNPEKRKEMGLYG